MKLYEYLTQIDFDDELDNNNIEIYKNDFNLVYSSACKDMWKEYEMYKYLTCEVKDYKDYFYKDNLYSCRKIKFWI